MNYTYRDAKVPCLVAQGSIVPAPIPSEYVICALLVPGSSVFTPWDHFQGSTEIPADFLHVEDEIYTLRVPGNLLTTFGEYLLRIQVIDDPITRVVVATFYFDLSIMESERRSVAQPTNDTCLLVGDIKDLSGKIPKFNDVEITYRPYGYPQLLSGAAVTSDSISTRTDIDGHFEMPCVRGALISFEIPKCGVRFQYTAPYDLDVVNMIDVFNTMLNS